MERATRNLHGTQVTRKEGSFTLKCEWYVVVTLCEIDYFSFPYHPKRSEGVERNRTCGRQLIGSNSQTYSIRLLLPHLKSTIVLLG